MNARWYNPSIGRFLTEDTYPGTSLNPQSQNRYSYVMNNPVNMWDPTGHMPWWVGQDIYFTTVDNGSKLDEAYIENVKSARENTINLLWHLMMKA